MLFPISGVETNPLIPPLVSFCISFFTSMGGVSGAFLLLPFQVSVLGFNTPAVSGTNHLFNVVAIPGGVYRYIREGRMVWPLTWAVILGTLPGVLAGAIIRVKYLPDPKSFKGFAALVLLYIGLRMVRDLLKSGGAAKAAAAPKTAIHKVSEARMTAARITYAFGEEQCSASTPGIFALALVVGVIGGTYGIGGGAIIAPFLVAYFGLPVYTVAGAALMGTCVTSVAGVLFYQAIAPFYPEQAVSPDWLLGVLFGLGGLAGTYLGARTQKHIPARYIKWMLSSLIVFLACKYLLDWLR